MPKRDDFDDENFFESIMRRNVPQAPMPPSMAKLLMGVAGLAVVITIAAVAWATWPSDKSRVDEETLPIMHADVETYKIKPEEPGGMVVPNKDSTIFDSLNSTETDKKVESLFDEPEEPLKKEDVFAGAAVDEKAQEELDDVVETIVEETPPQPQTEPVKQDVIETVKEEVVAKETPKDLPKEQVEEVVAEYKVVEEKPVVKSGTSYIQFAAVKSDADAKAKWKKLQSQYGFLSALPLRVEKADLGKKGTFYRVQSGPMALEQAQSTCDKIKAAKGDCLVVK